MKILYKPKMLPIECTKCCCIFVPKRRNLITAPDFFIKDKVICPICHELNNANFEGRAKQEEKESEDTE